MKPCSCNSQKLYQSDYTDPNRIFIVDGKEYSQQRKGVNNKVTHQQMYKKYQQLSKNPIVQSLIQTSQLWLPSHQITQISWDEIEFNPVWFYKQHIAKNVPCVITDIMSGDDIYDRWADPEYMQNALENYNEISVSLTPDGFADSIKGEFFIEPQQIKMGIKSFLNHKETFPNAIPYIQHQNSSLTEEMWMLNAEVDQEPVKFLSKHFFGDTAPDAENIWIGYDNSVSAIHKDPYQNFYTTITGQKHFTLLPPIDILYMEEQSYQKAKWNYNSVSQTFSCNSVKDQTTIWITCNPDLQQDIKNQKAFPWLQKMHKFHVVLEKGKMLYLPSLWYHQVSQKSNKDPYTCAINYWFDMDFNQNYSLYEMCRKIKGL